MLSVSNSHGASRPWNMIVCITMLLCACAVSVVSMIYTARIMEKRT